MRLLVRVAMTVLLLGLVPAGHGLAQSDQAKQVQTAELDRLFDDLSAARDEATARSVADRIWRIWTQPDDPALAARMAEIITGGGLAGPVAQLPLLDDLVADYPDYAEGWNQRATVRFLRGDYDGALADIEQVLKREPRHFGALAGQALIYHTQGKGEEALAAMKAALDIHPFLPERTLFPQLPPPPTKS